VGRRPPVICVVSLPQRLVLLPMLGHGGVAAHAFSEAATFQKVRLRYGVFVHFDPLNCSISLRSVSRARALTEGEWGS
jgi:hypothetical protein